MVVKSKAKFEHIDDLENIFKILRNTFYALMLLSVLLA